MAGVPAIGVLEPTQDERTIAVLAHVLQVVGWWIAPLIIFLTKRESRFVSFHALQALLLQIAYMALSAAFMGLWFVGMFVMMAHAPAAKNAPPPLGLFVLMATVWLGWIGMWVMTLVVAIVYAVKASRGKWSEYPLLGRLSRRILNLGAGGAVIP